MSITGKLLYNKIRELRPDLSSGITPEILSTICDDSRAQPFLEWFYKNVSCANILSNDEIKIKNTLQDAGEWLEGEALDAALEEATKDYPELLQLVSLDNSEREDLFLEHETLKENCKEDEDYLGALKTTIKDLKEIENQLDDNIEEAEITLDEERIQTEKVYDNCNIILKEFDRDNCQFSKDIDILLNMYADAAKNQGNAILWSQMPLELFIKQMELYNHYLDIHIKRQFGNTNKKVQEEDSDYASLIDDSKEKQIDERMQELLLCKTNLTNSKLEEISAIFEEESCLAMLQCVKEIYNDGIVKIPESNKLQDEILTLSTKRDFLEQNLKLLWEQQFSEVAQFAEMETIKILRNDALARLERRKIRLEKLKNLHSLAGVHGHVYVDLLCILMEMQYHTLREVAEFIADARHYITTEYKLSFMRCEIMQQQQDKYSTLITQSPDTYNAFNRIFISMMLGDDNLDKSLVSALKKYNDLIVNNAEKKKVITETCLNDKIDELQKLERNINKHYIAEIQTGPTNCFKPISYEISTAYEEVSTYVQEVQANITQIRNKLKERMRTDIDLEREKDILWQRFLADPDTLRMKYEEAKQKASESCFGDTVDSKLNL